MSARDPSSQGIVSLARPFTVAEELAHLSVSQQAYLQRHPQWQQLAVGALVFNAGRLLLVQRSATERAFPNVWEVPGGSVDADDETVLHAVARELEEETGLHVTSIKHEVGVGVQFRTGSGEKTTNWLKVAVEVEVAEQKAEAIAIRLDPVEHQDYLWVEEEDVRRGEVNGTRLEFMTADQRALVLEGFRLRRPAA
ncbi:nudix domain protein [Diplodia corticola]|uniref:Nudix domain protein n=1 Tax=Diplodia corticola TaxID=236234 RepID=A0A1J9RPT9_9PEZI|nr:nudix domain protein [Diplodia corticola]OJD29573.1 nudix domain protein [Diplodia corticola]